MSLDAIQIAAAVLFLCCFLCLFRIGRGPSAPDRAVALDILGTLIVGFCCLLALRSEREWLMNIAIAWALMSFIGTIGLAKYLERKAFDE